MARRRGLTTLALVATLVATMALLVAVWPRPAGAAAFRQFAAMGADAGGEPRVKVYYLGLHLVADFLAYPAGFRGGVRVAVGDVNGDGIADIVTAPGPGAQPLVKVYRGVCTSGDPMNCFFHGVDTASPVAQFLAFAPTFTGGVFVSVGNFDTANDISTGCQRNDIVVGADAGGGPHVQIFRNATVGGTCLSPGPVAIAATPLASFFAFPPAFTGGVRVAAADVGWGNSEIAELIVGAGAGGGPHVRIFRLSFTSAGVLPVEIASFFPYPVTFTGGVYVGTVPSSAMSPPELVFGAGAGGGPHVVMVMNESFSGNFQLNLTVLAASFLALDPGFTGGVRVSGATSFGTLLTAPGPGGPGVVKAFAFIRPLAFGQPGTIVETLQGGVPFGFSPLGVNLGR
jgi:hypothetical protein